MSDGAYNSRCTGTQATLKELPLTTTHVHGQGTWCRCRRGLVRSWRVQARWQQQARLRERQAVAMAQRSAVARRFGQWRASSWEQQHRTRLLARAVGFFAHRCALGSLTGVGLQPACADCGGAVIAQVQLCTGRPNAPSVSALA